LYLFFEQSAKLNLQSSSYFKQGKVKYGNKKSKIDNKKRGSRETESGSKKERQESFVSDHG
jgi:hypothetical protein